MRFYRESAFSSVWRQLDKLLIQPEGLKLRGSFSSSAIDNSVHVNQYTSRSLGTPMACRPTSGLVLAEDSPKRNGGGAEQGDTPGSPLIHLVKGRPPPPRLRNKVGRREDVVQ